MTPLLYLDHAATTKICDEARAAMIDSMEKTYGNPSSLHPLGKQAAEQLREDRAAVANALGCAPGEVYFTSGGTEADNWAILAALKLGRRYGKHIITTQIEHAAVLEPLRQLSQQGYEVTFLPPQKDGTIALSDLERALRPDTVLCSMMLVNNETGIELPVREAAKLIHESKSPCLLHTDAVQGFLKVPFTPQALGVDFLTVSGHKVEGPRGVGALYVKNGIRMPPFLYGGGQEEGLRPGTEPTPLIAGFAAACAKGAKAQEENMAYLLELKNYAVYQLERHIPDIVRITEGTVPHILCLAWPGYKSEVLVRVLGDLGVCVSAGSACHRGKASHVYAALKIPPAWRDGAFRVSFSHSNTKEEVDILISALQRAAEMLISV